MKSELIEVSPTQKEIKLQVEPEAMKAAYARVSQKYAKGANVPGFRKGYAPLDVVKLRYKDEIKNDVLQQILPSKVAEAIQEHALSPLSEPQLHIENVETIKVNGSEPIGLHVHVEVMPEIPVPKYEGMDVTRTVRPVSDSAVDDLIQHRLKEHAALMPVEERASETGDTVIADLEGRFEDDPDGEPITAEALEVELGGENIEAAFTENLVGVRPDDEKEFSVSYPADFSSSALAGRTVNYKATVKSVGHTELPELNDEWAVSLDEGYDSLADLRGELRKDLESYSAADADARVRNDAMAKLIEENSFEVPATLIENQARNLLNNFAQDLHQRGVDLNRVQSDFIQMAFEQMRSQAERDVRGAMLLEKIAEAEKVEVIEAEVEEELNRMADHYRSTPDEIRESLKKQGGEDTIRNNLRTRKAIEALVAKAKVTDGKWKEPSTEAETEPETGEQKPVKAKPKPAEAKEPKKRSAKTKS
ncbi:MAG: trigger factor [Pyrinomonadaceae bacterium]